MTAAARMTLMFPLRTRRECGGVVRNLSTAPTQLGPSAWAVWVDRRRTTFLAAALLLAVATVALRLWHQGSAYELFMDEIQYADVGNSFAAGRGPELFGEPFFLHPPLFFALLGRVIGDPVPHMTVEFVLGLRWVNLVFAAANALLVVAIAKRVVGHRGALLAGALYALDPFIVRFDSRLMLEASMMTGILVGVLAALLVVDQPALRRRYAWLLLTGLAFGAAATTKSTSVVVTTVPLLLMIVTSWGLRRREAAAAFAVQCAVYAAYLLWVASTGRVGDWFDQTLGGIFRAVGVATQTGYNAPGGSSFADRVLANLGMFASSYLVIVAATGYASYLLVTDWRSLRSEGLNGSHALHEHVDALRVLMCWLAGVLVAIAYTFGFGEVEEQTFYMLAVPSTVVAALLATHTAQVRLTRASGHVAVQDVGWHRAMCAILAVTLFACFAGSAAAWWRVHSERDDTYRQLVAFVYSAVEPRTNIALGEHTAQFILPGYGVHKMYSIDDALRTSSRYALVSTELSQRGLAPAPTHLVDELDRRYHIAFAAHGRTAGDLRLYDLNQPRDASSG
jgi:hypothetical protein